MISTATRPDFSDWLSPMLVKELRQGMRSRVFMMAFYLTQLMMILCVVLNLAAAANTEAPPEVRGILDFFFWMMIAAPLLIVMPVRGFGALHSELRARTLELVFLTRLSSFRIAAGKWTALMVQSLLLVCSVLPYVILRYFTGAVDILGDLQNLFFLMAASALLTAVTIALSPHESKALRVMCVLGFIFVPLFLLMMLPSALAAGGGRLGAGSSLAPWQLYVAILGYLPAVIFLGLQMAASKIAPPAENHALPKRLVGLYLLAAAPFFVFDWNGSSGREAAMAVSFFFLVAVVVDALAEPEWGAKAAFERFWRRGVPGQVAGFCFAPGWPTAAWYIILLTAVASGMVALFALQKTTADAVRYVAYFGWLVFPAALLRFFIPKTRHFLSFYIGLQFFFALVTVLVSAIGGMTDSSLRAWLEWIPNCAFWLSIFDHVTVEHAEPAERIIGRVGVVSGLAMLVLILQSLRPLRDMRLRLSEDEAAKSRE